MYLNGFLAFGAGATCIKLVVQPWMSDIVRSWPIWLLHAVAGLSFIVVVIDAAITQAGLRSLDSRLAKVSEGIKALKSQQIRQIDTRISEADEQWRETSAKLRGQAEQAYDRFAAREPSRAFVRHPDRSRMPASWSVARSTASSAV